MSADRFRTFGDTFGKGAPAFLHVADTGVVFTNADGQLTTGAWRAATPADIGSTTSLSVSGLSLTVGAVAVTGNPLMQVSNPIAVTGTHPVTVTNPLAVTGNPQFQISNGVVPISGWVNTVFTGSVAASFDSTSIVNAQVTGNNYLGFISGREAIEVNFLSGISGRLNSVVPISGVVQASVSIGAVAVTGGSISINNAIVPISGVVQAQVSSGPIVDAVASGNSLAITSNVLLSGISGALAGNLSDTALVRDVTGQLYLAAISGLLSSNLSDPAWVTGAVSIVGGGALNVAVTGGVISSSSSTVAVTGGVTINGGGALNVAVTGGVISSSSSNPVGVTGTKMDNNVSIWGTPASPYALLPIGGRAVAATGAGSITGGYNTGDYVMFSFNKDNGGLMVNQGALSYEQDTVTVVNSGSASVNNPAPSGNYPYTGTQFFFGQALAANPQRLEMFVQNTHTGIPLYVRLHTGAASTGSFSMILNPSTIQGWAGTSFGSSTYKGAVQVSGGSWIAWEI